MKALLFVLSLVGILYATQDDLTLTQVSAAQRDIKSSGYKCDTVDGKPFFSDSYTIETKSNIIIQILTFGLADYKIVKVIKRDK